MTSIPKYRFTGLQFVSIATNADTMFSILPRIARKTAHQDLEQLNWSNINTDSVLNLLGDGWTLVCFRSGQLRTTYMKTGGFSLAMVDDFAGSYCLSCFQGVRYTVVPNELEDAAVCKTLGENLRRCRPWKTNLDLSFV